MASEITAIIRKFARNNAIFNDKLKDGNRSIKVWGWNDDADYANAIAALVAAGYVCELTHKTGTVGTGGDLYKINEPRIKVSKKIN